MKRKAASHKIPTGKRERRRAMAWMWRENEP